MTELPSGAPRHCGPLGRAWLTMVAAAKVGATLFWGLPRQRLTLPSGASAPETSDVTRETSRDKPSMREAGGVEG
jgi:hypothetical protein